MKWFAVFLFVGLASNKFTFVTSGSCPSRKVIDDFNLTAFAGIWYDQKHTRRTTGSNLRFICDKVTFTTPQSDSEYMNFTSESYNWMSKKMIFVSGDAESMVNSGKLNVSIPSLNVSGGEVSVLDTDYKTYAVLWSCEAKTFGHSTREVILTREQRPRRDVLRTATRVLGANTKHKLSNTVQRNCPRQASQCNATESNQLGAFTTIGALVFLKKTLTSLPIISTTFCCDGPTCLTSNTSSSTPSSTATTSITTPLEIDGDTTTPTTSTESNSSPDFTSLPILTTISSTVTDDISSSTMSGRVITASINNGVDVS